VARASRPAHLCVTLADPGTDVFEEAPLICIEILSRRDEIDDVLEKLAEYRALGAAYIWLIDPRRKQAFVFDGGLRELAGPNLTAPEAGIGLPLSAVFESL
jgi:Uma2 family endonuclease